MACELWQVVSAITGSPKTTPAISTNNETSLRDGVQKRTEESEMIPGVPQTVCLVIEKIQMYAFETISDKSTCTARPRDKLA